MFKEVDVGLGVVLTPLVSGIWYWKMNAEIYRRFDQIKKGCRGQRVAEPKRERERELGTVEGGKRNVQWVH